MKIALSAATILIVAAASSALAASDKSRPPLSQETKIKVGDNPARDQIKTTFREVERKEVFDLPARMVQLVLPQFWSNPSRELAKNYPPSALAVERVRGGVSQPCTTFYDRVNLAFVRVRGFRLVGYSVEPTAPRYGHVLASPVEAIAVQTSKGDVYTANLQNADQIRIRPPLFVKREGNYDVCWSGYRLSVTLEGPKGVDPFGFQRGGGRPRDR